MGTHLGYRFLACWAAMVGPPVESPTAQPATSPVSAFFDSCLERFEQTGQIDPRWIESMKKEKHVSGLSPAEKAKHGHDIRRLFSDSLQKGAPKHRRLFDADAAPCRDGLADVLQALDMELTDEDLEKVLLPEADRIDNWCTQVLASRTFADFLRKRKLWGNESRKHLKQLLADPKIIAAADKPLRLFDLARLACHTGIPEDEQMAQAALDAAYLRTTKMSESEIVAILSAADAPGRLPLATVIDEHLRRRLAEYLFDLPVENWPHPAPDAGGVLSPESYVDLAGHRPPWLDWSKKLVKQFKDPELRNPRALEILTRCAGRTDSDFVELSRLLEKEPDLFVYLHGNDGKSGPWPKLNDQSPANFGASLDMLEQFVASIQGRKEARPAGLLTVLGGSYYTRSRSRSMSSVLQPLAQDAPAFGTPLGRKFITELKASDSFLDWDDRWSLSWTATGHAALADPLPTEGEDVPAVVLLGEVCRAIPLDGMDSETAAKKINNVFGGLLGRIQREVFEEGRICSREDDASAGETIVIGELFRLLKAIDDHRRRFGWKMSQLGCIPDFWQGVRRSFEAAANAQPPQQRKMGLQVRLMVRICVLFGNPEPIRYLLRSACPQLFQLPPPPPEPSPHQIPARQTPNPRHLQRPRVLDPSQLDRQVKLFQTLGPEIVEALTTIRQDWEQSHPEWLVKFDNDIVAVFQQWMFLPLLQTDGFLAHFGDVKTSPWMQLPKCYQEPERRYAAYGELLDVIGKTRFINAPEQVVELAAGCYAASGVRPWLNPEQISLSENLNLPAFKRLLDLTSRDLSSREAVPGAVLDRIMAVWNEPPRVDGSDSPMNLWLKSQPYLADGTDGKGELEQRESWVDYLSNLLGYAEARDSPFRKIGQEDVFDLSLPDNYKYTPELGPVYRDLPEDGVWTRAGVSGRRRQRLYECLIQWLDSPKSKHAEPREVLIRRIAAIPLLLPNRDSHLVSGESLEEFEKTKGKAIQLLREAGTNAVQAESLAEITTLQLRYWFSVGPGREKNDSAGHSVRKASEEAYIFLSQEVARKYPYLLNRLDLEQVALRSMAGGPAHFWHAIESDLERLLPVLSDRQRKCRDMYLQTAALRRAASHADHFLNEISESEVVILALLMRALAARDLDHSPTGVPSESRGRARIPAQTGAMILRSYALVLPYHCLDLDLMLPKSESSSRASRDRLIMFSLLSAEAKQNLRDWLLNEPGESSDHFDPVTRATVRQLLIDHNRIAMTLASRVFSDPKLLQLTLQKEVYHLQTIDFAILYDRGKSLRLDAAELLAGALEGCRINFELFSPDDTADVDRSVLGFLFQTDDPADLGTGLTRRDFDLAPAPSLDDLLREIAWIANTSRYDDATEDIRHAAEAFQKNARQFIDSPPPLHWYGGKKITTLRRPQTYFRACELAAAKLGSSIPQAATGSQEPGEIRDEMRRDYAALWTKILLGEQPAPVWQADFVRCFCSVGRYEAQQKLIETLVRGNSPEEIPDPLLRLDGMKRIAEEIDESAAHATDKFTIGFYRAFWNAAMSALHAAEVGIGLAESDVFLAKPLLKEPGGPVRTLSQEELHACAEGNASSKELWAALDWTNRFEDEFPQPRLRELLGDLALELPDCRKTEPGIGGCPVRSETDMPRSYRHAVWLAISHQFRQQVDASLQELDGTTQLLRKTGAQYDPLKEVERCESNVCNAMLELARTRTRYEALRVAWIKRSKEDFETVHPSRDDAWASACQRRDEAWAWYRADTTTIRWAKELMTEDSWGLLAPIWLPAEQYLGEQVTRSESDALDLTPKVWSPDSDDAELQSFAMLCFLSKMIARDKKVWLDPACRARYDRMGGVDAQSDTSEQEGRCLRKLREWTDLDQWHPSMKSWFQAGTSAPTGHPVWYQYKGLSRDDLAARLGTHGDDQHLGEKDSLAMSMVDRCCFSAKGCADWKSPYEAKMEIVRNWDGATARLGAASLSAEFYDLLCRIEPFASPYRPETNGARGWKLVAPAEDSWIPAPGASLDPALKRNLARWYLLQRDILADGRMVTRQAGFLGYVDLRQKVVAGPNAATSRKSEAGSRLSYDSGNDK